MRKALKLEAHSGIAIWSKKKKNQSSKNVSVVSWINRSTIAFSITTVLKNHVPTFSYNWYNISADCTGAWTVTDIHFPMVRVE